LPVLWLVVSVVFLPSLVPRRPHFVDVGEGTPAADIAATRHAYGLDIPLRERYQGYSDGVAAGDLGRCCASIKM